MAPEIIDLTASSPPHEHFVISSDTEVPNPAPGQSIPRANQDIKKKRKKRTKRSTTVAEGGEYARTPAETSREQSSERTNAREDTQPRNGRKTLLERIEVTKRPTSSDTPEEGEILDEKDAPSTAENTVDSSSRTELSSKKKRKKKRKKAEGSSLQTQSAQEPDPSSRTQNDKDGLKKRAKVEERERGVDRERERKHDDKKDRNPGSARKRGRDDDEDRSYDQAKARDKDREHDRNRRRTPPRRRSRSPDPGHRDKKSKHPTFEADLFFVDTDKIEVPISVEPTLLRTDDSTSVTTVTTIDALGLLLPAHVSLFGKDDGESTEILAPPADEASEDEDFIEFLAYDDDRKIGMVRYFDDVDQEAKSSKPKKFICKRCGAEGEHRTYECPVLICLTCGARDEHPTRSCPISKTCFTCGMKGHINATCPNRSLANYTSRLSIGCDRCGSRTHKTNECPTLWRIYQYVDDAEQKIILDARAQLRNIPLGEGGEGYIATDEWCYNCGGCGHLGDDCKDRPHSFDFPLEPSAFSVYNLLTGPFAETYTPAAPSRAPREWETEDAFADGFGFEAPLAVGKNGRRKERMRLEQYAREAEDARDEDDWFARTNKTRSNDQRGDRDMSPKKPAMKLGHLSDAGRFGQRDDGRRSAYGDLPEPMRETDSLQIRGAARRPDYRPQGSRHEYSSTRRDRDRDRDRDRNRGQRYHGGYS